MIDALPARQSAVCTDLLAIVIGLVGMLFILAGAVIIPYAFFMVWWMHAPVSFLLTFCLPAFLTLVALGAWLFLVAHRRCERLKLNTTLERGWTRWLALAMAALLYPAFAPILDPLSCELGPPPASAGSEQGVRSVCEGYLRNFDYASSAEPLDKATRRLAFKPVSLESTPFRDFKVLGGRPDFFGDGGPAALHRTFRTPQGYVVDLREWDMSGGGQISSRAELQTEQVNGKPAQLTVFQAPSGKAVSLLAWSEGQRSYELFINANVKTSTVSPTLLELANSIPRSVPPPIGR